MALAAEISFQFASSLFSFFNQEISLASSRCFDERNECRSNESCSLMLFRSECRKCQRLHFGARSTRIEPLVCRLFQSDKPLFSMTLGLRHSFEPGRMFVKHRELSFLPFINIVIHSSSLPLRNGKAFRYQVDGEVLNVPEGRMSVRLRHRARKRPTNKALDPAQTSVSGSCWKGLTKRGT